ncbi:MAG: M28 family peptidase [Bacteroidetes bacterium]|nr:M28 family peptidase [Bacteroidota bacterium]
MNKYLLTALLFIPGLKGKTQNLQELKRDMYGIASDATEGRFTGSQGYLKAARYVERQLTAAGLYPGWTEHGKKTYLQPVPFVWDDYSGSSLVIRGVKYPHAANNFIVLQRGPVPNGKWLVVSPGDSIKGKPAGIVLLPGQNKAGDWETTVIRQYRFGYMHYVPDGSDSQAATPTILVSPVLAKQLVAGDSLDITFSYKARRKTGYNVIGVLPGSSRRLRHQAIVVSAHLDHIGRIGEHIYNGANDDASGCVASLGSAKILALHPCKRPFVFAFFCGEELNLKGSGWFVHHLPALCDSIFMAINLEQLGSKHRSYDGVWALGNPECKPAFYAAGSHFDARHLQFSAADSVKEELRNTDLYSFIDKNIPALLLGSGGFDEHHTPQDKIDLIDFEHLQKATLLLYKLITLIGNQPPAFTVLPPG